MLVTFLLGISSRKQCFLTIVIDPRVLDLLHVVPLVGSSLARDYHGRLPVVVVLELGFEVKGNHGGFSIVV